MHTLSGFKTCSLCLALTWPVFAAGPALVVDRGLPQANLNSTSGDYRSNIRWSLYESGFLGDDFTVGARRRILGDRYHPGVDRAGRQFS